MAVAQTEYLARKVTRKSYLLDMSPPKNSINWDNRDMRASSDLNENRYSPTSSNNMTPDNCSQSSLSGVPIL